MEVHPEVSALADTLTDEVHYTEELLTKILTDKG